MREVRDEFKLQSIKGAGVARAEIISDRFDELTSCLERLCTPGREFSIAKTKLQEAFMFAVRAVKGEP